MATNVVMPQMGYDMREGTVVRWHKAEGETVNRGEVIADIETDKATVEFEAYTGGVLGRIVAEAGVAVPVGELIAIITEPGEAAPDVPGAAPDVAVPAAVTVVVEAMVPIRPMVEAMTKAMVPVTAASAAMGEMLAPVMAASAEAEAALAPVRAALSEVLAPVMAASVEAEAALAPVRAVAVEAMAPVRPMVEAMTKAMAPVTAASAAMAEVLAPVTAASAEAEAALAPVLAALSEAMAPVTASAEAVLAPMRSAAAVAMVPVMAASAAATAALAPVMSASSAVVPAGDGQVRASPIARRLARERGIDLALVSGSGPNGRITERDVENYQAPVAAVSEPAVVAVPVPAPTAAPAAAPATTPAAAPVSAPATAPADSRIELSRMRQTIARVTSDSKTTAPHFYVTAEIDMGKAMALRRDVNDAAEPGNRVSVNDLMVKACALALGKHPKFNSFYRGDHLQVHGAMNIGIAIALESGLILPGVSNCESKSLVEIAAATKDLIARANSGTLRNEEYSETTFSISNMGMFDVESFTAIIYPPHAAILAVGSVKQQPVVREGQLDIGLMMKATLSTDHRVADGAEAAQFLMEIKRILENPVRLLL